MALTASEYRDLIEARVFSPSSLRESLQHRKRWDRKGWDGKLLMVAADHTSRGKIALGQDPTAMADRFTLLDRLTTCLAIPEVDGVLGSADVLEELAWLGALDGKIAIGTMNRGGIIGAAWELDDRLTSFDVEHIIGMGLDGGKSLIRIDYNDPGVPRTIESVAQWATELNDHSLMTFIEPLPYAKNDAGQAVLDTDPDSLIKVVAVASGLGASSAHTWLKIPPSERMEEIAASTSLPILMLGGEPQPKGLAIHDSWREGLRSPNVRGILAGRTLLYPPSGDVHSAVTAAAALIRPT